MGKKAVRIYKKISENNIVLSIVISLIIFLSVFFNTYIPLVFLFLYIAVFKSNYILSLLLTIPIYEAHFLGIPLSINKILIIILVIVFLIHINYKKIKITKNEIFIFLMLFTITLGGFIGLFNSDLAFMREIIFKEYLFDLLSKVGFMFIFVLAIKTSKNFNIKEMVKKATYFIPIFIVFLGVLAYIYQYDINFSRSGILNIRPNYFSVFAMCLIPFVIYAFFYCKEKLMIVISLVAVGVEIYILSITNSRTGLLMLGVSLLISVLVFYKINKRRIWIGIPLGILGVLSIMFLPSLSGLIERLFQASYLKSLSKFLNGRYELFEAGFKLILNNPILGYGSSEEVTAFYIYNISGISQVAHNLFLETIIQYGAYGTIIFLGIYFYFISEFIIKAFNRFAKRYRWELTLYIVFFSVLVAGLFLSIDWRDIYIYSIMFLFALPYRKKEEEVKNGD